MHVLLFVVAGARGESALDKARAAAARVASTRSKESSQSAALAAAARMAAAKPDGVPFVKPPPVAPLSREPPRVPPAQPVGTNDTEPEAPPQAPVGSTSSTSTRASADPIAASATSTGTRSVSEEAALAFAEDDGWAAAPYRRLELANTSALLEVVASLPMVFYRTANDSIEGRTQLGVRIEDLEHLMPEAVQVGRRAIVDQTALFMHALGATQELAKRQTRLRSTVDGVSTALNSKMRKIEAIRVRAWEETRQAKLMLQEIETERKRQETLAVKVVEAQAATEKTANEHRKELAVASLGLEDELAKRRLESEDASRRREHREEVEAREQAALAEQALRGRMEAELQTKQLENDKVLEALHRDAEIARVRAEAEARAEAERVNEDVRLRLLRARKAQELQRAVAAVTLAAEVVAKGATALLLHDRMLLGMLVAAVLGLVAAGFFSREAATLARQLAEAYFGRPRLVRETSLKRFARGRRWLATAARLVMSVRLPNVRFSKKRRRLLEDRLEAARAARAAASRLRELAFLDGVVLDADIRDRLSQLAMSTRNAKRNRAPFRHVLLHGPPGTGKTMAAKRLARASGLSYALMSGGDVGPLGADGVTALHSLFRWAHAADDGLLIFIDEAEAFLATRASARLTEHMRNALNAFLYQTGSPTSAFVIVLATNRPSDLDPAVLDRVDETLYFGLPTREARRALVPLYYHRYLGQHKALDEDFWATLVRACLRRSARLRLSAGINDEVLRDVADETRGFSAREIEKLLVAVQSVAYGRGGALETSDFLAVVRHKCEEHSKKARLYGQLASARPRDEGSRSKDPAT